MHSHTKRVTLPLVVLAIFGVGGTCTVTAAIGLPGPVIILATLAVAGITIALAALAAPSRNEPTPEDDRRHETAALEFSRRGHSNTAVSQALLIGDDVLRTKTLVLIAHHCIDRGDIPTARRIAHGHLQPKESGHILQRVACEL